MTSIREELLLPRPLAVAIVSGGLDSVTLAYHLSHLGYKLHLLSFDYGQRHKKELLFAQCCALNLGAKLDIIDLTSITRLLKGSSLTDNVEVPEGHYTAENMASTVVPNRNAMMLSIAYAVAVAEKADLVAIGVHAGDHAIYPDCRPDFIEAFEDMESAATEGYSKPNLHTFAPFVYHDKEDIVRIGHVLGVKYEQTWSCYKGGDKHCGKCGTCVERIEAFERAGVTDPTEYEDTDYAFKLLHPGINRRDL